MKVVDKLAMEDRQSRIRQSLAKEIEALRKENAEVAKRRRKRNQVRSAEAVEQASVGYFRTPWDSVLSERRTDRDSKGIYSLYEMRPRSRIDPRELD